MKKIIIFLIFSTLFLSGNNSAFASQSCDQVFDGGHLRYNYTYRFFDVWHNGENRNVYLNNFRVDFINSSYLDQGQPFGWTNQLRNNGFKVNPQSSMRVLETGSNWRIASKPNVRTNGTRNSYDFGIQYTIGYDYSNNYPDSSDDRYHKECVYYSVTWCGDGVVDTAYGEICDPNDPSRRGWGDLGCDAQCKPIFDTTPPPPTTTTTTSTSGGTPPPTTTTTTTTSGGTPPPTTTTTTSTSGGGGGTTSTSGGGGGTTSTSGGGGGGGTTGGGFTYCGDGRVQRPSAEEIEVSYNCQTGVNISGTPIYGTCTRIDIKYVMEECDFGSGTWPNWCGRPGTANECKITGNLSFPAEGALEFGPRDSVIVGAGMNPYEAYTLQRPSVRNVSSFDYYFDSLCVVYNSGNTLVGNTVCQPFRGVFRAGSTFRFTNYPNFVGNTGPLTAGSFGDNVLVTTIQNKGVIYTDAYFAGKLNVRVSKPSVSTTGGGTSYVSSTENITNVSNIVPGSDSSNNKNFVGVGVSTGDISSYSNEVTDSSSVSEVERDGTSFTQNTIDENSMSSSTISSTDNISNFGSYNGIKGAYYLKDSDFVVKTGTFSGLTGPRTYIIENGNLIIENNINYPDNIAFVVRGGNIKIDRSVTTLNGIYISIPKGSLGGDIESLNGNTTNRLNVNGSLYGNINKLSSSRTFIRQNSSGQLDVGTIVSFGSSIFRSPAPLTSTFINEYMEATKVAK